MVLWRRHKDDPTVKTPAELQERTDEVIALMRSETQRAKIVTTLIKQRVDVLEAAHRGH